MNKLFRAEGPIFTFLNKVTDIIFLNLLFLAGCIPIITAGASLTALTTTAMKCICREEGYIFKTFWHTFKCHWKHSTVFFLILCAANVIFYIDIVYCNALLAPPLRQVVIVVILSVGLLFLLVSECLFPYMGIVQGADLSNEAVTKMRIIDIVKAAAIPAVGCLPATLLMTIINLLPVILTFALGALYTGLIAFYFFFGFAAAAVLNGFLMWKSFEKMQMV
ncbi:MAG: YesL family protein [Hespellia sp.]|nr:YesL family protein [Hespellia sp.]